MGATLSLECLAALEGTRAAASVGMIALWLAILIFVLGILLGFLIGTRARQIAESARSIPQALAHMSFKIPAAGLPDPGAGDDDEKDQEDEDDANAKLDSLLDDFIQDPNADASLNDHPDLQISPVIMYNIKKSKEELRTQQLKAQLAAEGMTAEEIEERLLLGETGGGGAGGGKQNALSLLIAAGARVQAMSGGANADNIALQERRRAQRNVDTYLTKTEGIEKFVNSKAAASKGQGEGGKVKSAREVAYETARNRAGGVTYEREVRSLAHAKSSRNIWKEWNVKEGHKVLPEITEELAIQEKREKRKQQEVGQDAQAQMLAALQAEVEAGDDDDSEGEEGEEGEEEEGLDA